MLNSGDFRELLLAEVVLSRRLLPPGQVAAALELYWARDSSTLRAILEETTGLGSDALEGVEAEVHRLVEVAGGDARRAVAHRKRLSHAVTSALSRHLSTAPRTWTGVGGRVPLRGMAEGRYMDVLTAGEGGMGVVYMALDTELQRMVALKMVRPGAAARDPEDGATTPIDAARPGGEGSEADAFEALEARFLQEAWVTGGLEHPGIVPVYELGRTQAGIPYYTMKFIGTQRMLSDAIEDAREAPVDERLTLLEPFLRVCDAVSYAHSNDVIHRDIKSENIALGEFGEVILLDWGLAKLRGQEGPAEKAWQQQVREFRAEGEIKTIPSAFGTPGYMSPEAAVGRIDEVDERSDVYSLGTVLFEILTCRRPFQDGNYLDYVRQVTQVDPPDAHTIDAAVPRELAAICTRALARERGARTESVDALSRDVRRWQAANALDRELDDLVREAGSLLDEAEQAKGEDRIAGVDAAAGGLARVTSKRPDHPAALALAKRADELRERGIREREDASVRRARRREVLRAAAVLTVLAAGVGLFLLGRAKVRAWEHEDMESEAEAAYRATEGTGADEAIPRLSELPEAYPHASVLPRSIVRLAERYAEVRRPERAQATWAEAYTAHPNSPWATEAFLALGRAFAREGDAGRTAHVASTVLSTTKDDAARARALLLAAEAALSQEEGDGAKALGWLQLAQGASAHLDAPDRLRLETLADLMADFLPRERFSIMARHAAVGRFRAGGVQVVVSEEDAYHLHTFGEEGLSELPLRGVLRSDTGDGILAADVDGDGVDELLQVTATRGSATEVMEVPQEFRVWDLRAPSARLVSKVAGLPNGASELAVGDLDGDGDDDVVVGISYPNRKVVVLRNEGGRTFERMPLGEMGELNEANSDVRGVAVGDVTDDGANEVVLALDAFTEMSLLCYAWDAETGGFRLLPPAQRPHGFVGGCVVADADGDGDDDACYDLTFWSYRYADEVRARFRPQGIRYAAWNRDLGAFEDHGLEEHFRIRMEPTHEGDPPPLNLSFMRLRLAEGRRAGAVLTTLGSRHRGGRDELPWIHVFPLARGLDAGFVLHSPVQSMALCAADVDGDGEDEILVSDDDGTLTVYGRGPLPTPQPPRLERLTRPGATEGTPQPLAIARQAMDLRFHDLARRNLEALLPTLRGTPWEEPAVRDLVSAWAYQQRYDECVRVIEGRRPPGGDLPRTLEHLAATYVERLWRLDEAAAAFDRLATLGGLPESEGRHAAARARALAPWRREVRVALPDAADWRGHPDSGLTVEEDGSITASHGGESHAVLWAPLVLDDGSFRLDFDLRLDALPYGHHLALGFLQAPVPTSDYPGIAALVSHTSSRPRGINVVSYPRAARQAESQAIGLAAGLALDVWYRCRLVYDAPNARCAFVVEEREGGALHAVCTREGLDPPALVPLRFAVLADPQGWGEETRARITNLELRQPVSTTPVRTE